VRQGLQPLVSTKADAEEERRRKLRQAKIGRDQNSYDLILYFRLNIFLTLWISLSIAKPFNICQTSFQLQICADFSNVWAGDLPKS
jgi:hypothetical protein